MTINTTSICNHLNIQLFGTYYTVIDRDIGKQEKTFSVTVSSARDVLGNTRDQHDMDVLAPGAQVTKEITADLTTCYMEPCTWILSINSVCHITFL